VDGHFRPQRGGDGAFDALGDGVRLLHRHAAGDEEVEVGEAAETGLGACARRWWSVPGGSWAPG